MSDIMIRVDNLGKLYHIGAVQERHKTLVGSVADSVKTVFRRMIDPRLARTGAKDIEALWALKNVSFELKRGEVLGVIGRNGSGKSTLLKILSHITAPTEGRVELYGRVGSLLEVGIGFHPELTGRENIYLSGTILGMKKTEIDQAFDEIVNFSEVERFIDTPVKYYSSGMYVRLAFAVAAHFNPEILILDEVLAVGDASFQRKSLKKMESAAKSGRAVVFVSHGMSSIARLCNRCLLLNEGKVVYYGNTAETISAYLKSIHKIDEDRVEKEGDALPAYLDLNGANRWDGYAKKILTWVSTHRLDGESTAEFNTGDSMCIRIGYHLEEELVAYCQINFLDYAGTRVMQLHNTHNGPPLKLCGDGFIECVIDDLRLLAGNYIIMLDIGDFSKDQWLDCVGDTIHIKVSLGNYIGGAGLTQGQVPFAQRSQWKIFPGSDVVTAVFKNNIKVLD
jgi:lipopolysaccharide transport system ATP-binding protein